MRILALDLATKTGWCYWADNHLSCGTWVLASPKEIATWNKTRLSRQQDPRVRRLYDRIAEYCGKIDVLIHEDVMFASSTLAVQMFAALRSAVWLSCGDSVLRETLPVQTLKKSACGHGGATKEMMMGACARHYPERFTFDGTVLFDKETKIKLDDNTADAIMLARWAHHNLSRAKI